MATTRKLQAKETTNTWDGVNTFTQPIVGDVTSSGASTFASVNGRVYPSSGGDFGAKIVAAIDSLPASGGIVDCSRMSGTNQACSTDPFSTVGSKKVRVILPACQITTTASWSLPGRLIIEGAGRSHDQSGGTRIKSSGAIWLFSGSASTDSNSGSMTNLTIDLTGDTSALGGILCQRILRWEFRNINIVVPSTGTAECVRLDGTSSAYYNLFENVTCGATIKGGSQYGFRIMNAANSNTFINCTVDAISIGYSFDTSNNNNIFGGVIQSFNTGITFSSATTTQGNAAIGVRMETNEVGAQGVVFGALSRYNYVAAPFLSGTLNGSGSEVVDSSSGANMYVWATSGSGGYAVFGRPTGGFQVGINKVPAVGTSTGGLDVTGQIWADNYLRLKKNGDNRIWFTNNAGTDTTMIVSNSSDDVQYRSLGGKTGFATGGGSMRDYADANMQWVHETANGATWLRGSQSELITLATGATTTDSASNLLPANSIIEAIVYRVTTTITTAANFSIGDATTSARFVSAATGLTSGTTGVGTLQADQTGASGPRQTAAAKIRITTNVNPGAGAIRVTVFYRQFTAPTS